MGMDGQSRLKAIAFVGEALGPFFLEDPRTGAAGGAFAAVAALDVPAAARQWPFVDDADAAHHLGLMVRGLENGADDEGLVREYRRLFIGPAPKPAPPWGSVYTDRERVVFGMSTLALRAWMRENGVARTDGERTPEDHIGLMLELMAWLAREQPESLGDYLRLHLLTWSTHFLDQLACAARQPFYEGLALITRDSLEGIRQELGLQVDYPRYWR